MLGGPQGRTSIIVHLHLEVCDKLVKMYVLFLSLKFCLILLTHTILCLRLANTFIVIVLLVASVYPSHLQFSMLVIRAELLDTQKAGLLLRALTWSLLHKRKWGKKSQKESRYNRMTYLYIYTGGKEEMMWRSVFKTWRGIRQKYNACEIELCQSFSKVVFPCLWSNPFISIVSRLIFKCAFGIIMMFLMCF